MPLIPNTFQLSATQEGKRDTQAWVLFSFTSNVMIPKSKSMLSTDLQNYLHGSKLIQIHTWIEECLFSCISLFCNPKNRRCKTYKEVW